MKILTLVSSLFLASAAFAGDADVETHKAKLLEEWTGRIASLEKAKTCVEGASTKDAIQACKKLLKSDMSARKEGHIDAKIKKLEDKKEKLNKE